jgi:hypothetical protein
MQGVYQTKMQGARYIDHCAIMENGHDQTQGKD